MTIKEFDALKTGDVVKIKDYQELLKAHNEIDNDYNERVIDLVYGTPLWAKKSTFWNSNGKGKIFHIRNIHLAGSNFDLNEISSSAGWHWKFCPDDFDVIDEDYGKVIAEEDFAKLF